MSGKKSKQKKNSQANASVRKAKYDIVPIQDREDMQVSDAIVHMLELQIDALGDPDAWNCVYRVKDQEAVDAMMLDLYTEGAAFLEYDGAPAVWTMTASSYKFVTKIILHGSDDIEIFFPVILKILGSGKVLRVNEDEVPWVYDEDLEKLYRMMRKKDTMADLIETYALRAKDHPYCLCASEVLPWSEGLRPLTDLADDLADFFDFFMLEDDPGPGFEPILLPLSLDQVGSCIAFREGKFVLLRYLTPYLMEDPVKADPDRTGNVSKATGTRDKDDRSDIEKYYVQTVYETEDAGQMEEIARAMWEPYQDSEALVCVVPLSSAVYALAEGDLHAFSFHTMNGEPRTEADLTDAERAAYQELQTIIAEIGV